MSAKMAANRIQRRQRGARGPFLAPLDFHNGTNIVDREIEALIVLFLGLFLLFLGLFFVAPPWKIFC